MIGLTPLLLLVPDKTYVNSLCLKESGQMELQERL